MEEETTIIRTHCPHCGLKMDEKTWGCEPLVFSVHIVWIDHNIELKATVRAMNPIDAIRIAFRRNQENLGEHHLLTAHEAWAFLVTDETDYLGGGISEIDDPKLREDFPALEERRRAEQ